MSAPSVKPVSPARLRPFQRTRTAVTVDAPSRTVRRRWLEQPCAGLRQGRRISDHIGGSWGTRTGQTRYAERVAVGPDGDVLRGGYWGNHRIQKFAPGVPGWRQVNINGFGDRRAQWISSLLPFQGSLYATGYPARIWRMTAAGVWSQVKPGLWRQHQ